MADPHPENQPASDSLSAEAAGYEPFDFQYTTNAQWVLAARILAGGPMLFYGLNHMMSPGLLRNMLAAMQAPGAELIGLVMPALELLLGLMLMIGAFARPAAGAGTALSGVLLWITLSVIMIKPDMLPPGITETPPTPSLPMPFLLVVANIIILIKGAGPVSVDANMTHVEPPPPNPDDPPLGIV